MGSFEKLGILVIVIIIVMILVVAIYQWGGADFDPAPDALRVPVAPNLDLPDGPAVIDLDDVAEEFGEREAERRAPDPKPEPNADRRGVPEVYVIKHNDKLWKLVRRWDLKIEFIDQIRAANPKVNMKRLRVGQRIDIPNPRGYFEPAKYRTYRVKEGDSLTLIAKTQLGRASRWTEIRKLNPHVDPKKIRPGMRLRLPLR